jgi:LytS/YehU family sensor histidine kinase
MYVCVRILFLQQIENAAGMDGREVLSTLQTTLSSFYLSIQPAAPISCNHIIYNTCMLGLVATTDGQSYTPIVAASVKDPQKGTFILSYTDPSSSSSIDFNHVITSFEILANSAANSIPPCIVPFGNASLTWDDETLCYH